MRNCSFLALSLLLLGTLLPAQRRVDPRYTYHRVIAVVPLVGSGAMADPIRGKYVPTAQTAGAAGTGIIAFAVELTDDGRRAIVELVSLQRTALAQVLADREPGVIVFEKGVAKDADIESAIQPLRKGFSLQNFGVMVQ